MSSLTDSWQLGGLTVPNRVVLAPLAGIGNWFVRLQAKRYGAGLASSEMISSHAIHYGNPKTLDELLVVRPEEEAGAAQLLVLVGLLATQVVAVWTVVELVARGRLLPDVPR